MSIKYLESLPAATAPAGFESARGKIMVAVAMRRLACKRRAPRVARRVYIGAHRGVGI